MPELPEVETIVNELRKEILNRRIEGIEIKVPRVAQGNVKGVRGLKIINIRRRAKLIIVELEKDLYLAIHLKLTGQLFFVPKGEKQTKTGEGANKFTSAIFNFSDGSKLVFNDRIKFGYIKVITSKEQLKNIEDKYGPEPINPSFSLEQLKEMFNKKPKLRIKPLLMDQSFIAGIGNIYSDEILFYTGVLPTRKVRDLTEDEIKKLHNGMQKILKEALKYKGSSMDTYKRTTGEKGTYYLHRKVYRRKGEDCIRCHGKITSLKFGGRTSYFCPGCQK
ncbi:MAG: DNA-formamidopyrimidine glycosylase [Candidatus Berkelbacteria bacterium]|nr:DNA-formamidopyrimidine glycosylase [Candidatus Berkelbacteria bacterium]